MRLRLAHELLDDDEGSPEEIRQGLDDLWWINRHLGGLSSWRRLLRRYLQRAGQPPGALRILDIGAGTGQLAEANAAWLRQRGFAVVSLRLDRRPSHLLAGAGAGLPLAADALRLPFADRSVELVTCNLFLHHFHDRPGDPLATRLLAEMARVASRAVLVNDLQRSWIPYLFTRVCAARFTRLTRHDAPRSVAQAYTRRELERLARAAGAAQLDVVRLWPYRLGLIWITA